ncbi:MAG: ZPR1 zinc finger domain-containing protein [Nanoarchaeota archaeon]|nr:ZPR1 zinc finger domain-containing protein [Nanoarchaeota archaeon]
MKENKKETDEGEPSKLEGQECPICHKKTLTLLEEEKEIPYFGKCFIFSMTCSDCRYHKADIESAERKEPAKYTLDIDSEADMKIRVVRSSEGTINLVRIAKIEGGPASNGFITNVEGIINRIRHQTEALRDSEEDPAIKKKAKTLLKKLTKIAWGQEKAKLVISDPSGNSVIISDKAVKSRV